MRGSLGIAVALALLLALPSGAWAIEAKAGELLASPEQFHGKTVTLYGKVANVRARVSQQGNAYFTFRLNDESGTITVFSHGQPECAAGTVATVEGVFQRVKQVGRYTFRNQVEATSVSC